MSKLAQDNLTAAGKVVAILAVLFAGVLFISSASNRADMANERVHKVEVRIDQFATDMSRVQQDMATLAERSRHMPTADDMRRIVRDEIRASAANTPNR